MMITDISDRQLEIIEAASKLLTTSGVSGLTIKNLAREMKFSESAIYRHFVSKEEIIITLLEYLVQNISEGYDNAISDEQTSEEKFIALFSLQFAFFKTSPHFVVAVFSDGLLEVSRPINQIILKLMAVKMKHLMLIIQEGQQNGDFISTIAPDELLHIIMGTFRLLMFKWRVSNFEFDITKEGDKMIHSILTLIKT